MKKNPNTNNAPKNHHRRKILLRIWHWLIANGAQFISNIFSNHSHEQQFATRIPIHGTFKNPKPNNWAAIGGVIKNAFIQALTPTLDSTLHITDIDKRDEPETK